MHRRYLVTLLLVSFFVLAASPPFGAAQFGSPPRKDKNIWNYDGGLVMMTDGAIPNGPCFRLTGRLTAPNFFDNLKRIDTNTGPVIHRGNELVTEFPENMQLLFEMYDMPCPEQLMQNTVELENGGASRVYLDKSIITSLHVNFFWKRGLELRPATGVTIKHAEVHLIPPYAAESAKDLPEKFEWWFTFDVPSAAVPVTDSLVLVLRTRDNHIAARVAARL